MYSAAFPIIQSNWQTQVHTRYTYEFYCEEHWAQQSSKGSLLLQPDPRLQTDTNGT